MEISHIVILVMKGRDTPSRDRQNSEIEPNTTSFFP